MAFDSKYTGEEPTWDLQHTWSDEEFKREYQRMFGFYGYYLSSKDMRPDVVRFMKECGTYTERDRNVFAALPDWAISGTTGKIARSINRGLDVARVLKVTGEDLYGMVHGDISLAIKQYGPEYYEKTPQELAGSTPEDSQRGKETIQSRLKKKVISTLGLDFDNLLDTWMKGEDKVESLNVAELCAKHSVAPMGLKFLVERVEKVRDELEAARDKQYDEAVEGYAYLSKKGILNRIAALDAILAEVVKITHAKKATRKPRVKKPKSAEKQVSRLKFMQASAEFGIKSVSPITIPGSHRVYVFNTKYRILSCYEANSASGLEVKGSGIKNFSENASFSMRLRKPNDVLPEVISRTVKQIDKVTDSLKVKKTKPNGRMNDQMVILRTFANK